MLLQPKLWRTLFWTFKYNNSPVHPIPYNFFWVVWAREDFVDIARQALILPGRVPAFFGDITIAVMMDTRRTDTEEHLLQRVIHLEGQLRAAADTHARAMAELHGKSNEVCVRTTIQLRE